MVSFLFFIILIKCLIIPFLFSKTEGSRPFVPRYPHLDPLLGLDLVIRSWWDFNNGRLSEGFRQRHLAYGPTYVANTFGAPCIYTIEPANIRWITTEGFEQFGKAGWVKEAAKHIGDGILMNEGAAWKYSRKTLKPIFSRTAVNEPALLEPHVQHLIKNMRRLSETAGSFDFHHLASMFTLDVVTDFLFGKSTRCLGRGAKQTSHQHGLRFLALVKYFEGPSGKFIAIGPLAWLSLFTSYKRLIGVVNGMKAFFRMQLDEIIAEMSSGGSKGLAEGREIPPSVFRTMKAAGISDNQIQGELQNVFFASYDTTSTFLANLMYILSQHPDTQHRLREEIAFLGQRLPTAKELSTMKFLRMVIMEALRLYSPVSSHSRTAKVTTTLPTGGGSDGRSPIPITAGTTVVWSTYSLNRDPRLYGEDWAAFRPDRWTTARDFFMPFGSGPRACLGQQMVQTEVMYVVVRLLQEFSQISMAAGECNKPFKEAKAVSFYSDGGVHICIK
ncbi:cytochrome P450 [Cryphonectria parasitica EP155]|uniref:Cytochrome P450 n=1 Tax=Cryphonectria parasitica (strain ATCC 38755 / EP155) TaxID=660469 RepID=A0A9P4Y5G7_CRYP1|nr:cytochrome P450 [Cryphonectria parasitica EP155]KAF3766855.1 cytochrome P450 [Cryphonectria parasitica EP155]